MRARVVSTFLKGVDEKPADLPKEHTRLGEIIAEFSQYSTGWIHAVAWNASGSLLAFTGHDATITIVPALTAPAEGIKIDLPCLPANALAWANDSTIVGAGHDGAPFLIQRKTTWAYAGFVDPGMGKTVLPPVLELPAGSIPIKLGTKHQNTITSLYIQRDGRGPTSVPSQITTVGCDGLLVWWPIRSFAPIAPGPSGGVTTAPGTASAGGASATSAAGIATAPPSVGGRT